MSFRWLCREQAAIRSSFSPYAGVVDGAYMSIAGRIGAGLGNVDPEEGFLEWRPTSAATGRPCAEAGHLADTHAIVQVKGVQGPVPAWCSKAALYLLGVFESPEMPRAPSPPSRVVWARCVRAACSLIRRRAGAAPLPRLVASSILSSMTQRPRHWWLKIWWDIVGC